MKNRRMPGSGTNRGHKAHGIHGRGGLRPKRRNVGDATLSTLDSDPPKERGFSRDHSVDTAYEVFADSPGVSRELSVDTAYEVFAASPRPSQQTMVGPMGVASATSATFAPRLRSLEAADLGFLAGHSVDAASPALGAPDPQLGQSRSHLSVGVVPRTVVRVVPSSGSVSTTRLSSAAAASTMTQPGQTNSAVKSTIAAPGDTGGSPLPSCSTATSSRGFYRGQSTDGSTTPLKSSQQASSLRLESAASHPTVVSALGSTVDSIQTPLTFEPSARYLAASVSGTRVSKDSTFLTSDLQLSSGRAEALNRGLSPTQNTIAVLSDKVVGDIEASARSSVSDDRLYSMKSERQPLTLIEAGEHRRERRTSARSVDRTSVTSVGDGSPEDSGGPGDTPFTTPAKSAPPSRTGRAALGGTRTPLGNVEQGRSSSSLGGTKDRAATPSTPFDAKLLGMGDFRRRYSGPYRHEAKPSSTSAVAPRGTSMTALPGLPGVKQGEDKKCAGVTEKYDAEVGQVSAQDDKAVVVQRAPVTPAEDRPLLRRQKSKVFSLPSPGSPTVSIWQPSMSNVVQHIDKILPTGLRRLLLHLKNHSDLGMMALYAVTLERHQCLSRALQHLQALEAPQLKGDPTEAGTRPSSSPALSLRTRFNRWRRALKYPFGVPRPKARPPPLPPLPPTHRLRLDRVQRCLRDALEEGLGLSLPYNPSSALTIQPQLHYDSRWAVDACRILAAYITRAVSKLGLQRYRTACVVRMIEKRNQGCCTYFAALWDSDCDCYCSAVHETDTFLAHVILMLVYWD